MADMKYLQKRGGQWHYIRRVPKRYRDLDQRGTIRNSLGTDSLITARLLRNEQASEEDKTWKIEAAMLHGGKHEREEAAYEKAKVITQKHDLKLIDTNELSKAPLVDILKRLTLLTTTSEGIPPKDTVDALLGAVKPPSIPISKAFDLYCERIAIGQLLGKSESQKKAWRKAKSRAIYNFIEMHGDISMKEINREHARDFYNWWGERLLPDGDRKALAPNSANRDLGNLRKLYREYWDYAGDEDRQNPFRNLRFSGRQIKDTPHFEAEWIKTQILSPGIFDGLNHQATSLIYAMIETGCRPSELANLLPENIRLADPIPHLRIRNTPGRQLKSLASSRDIPLVGISLEAMKKTPNGFPHYRDKEALLSASLMKAFRARNLFPTPNHRIYSIRHSFEKRMLEAGIDYGLRCTLMGHKNTRPTYGDGGSLEFRRDALLKIKISYPHI